LGCGLASGLLLFCQFLFCQRSSLCRCKACGLGTLFSALGFAPRGFLLQCGLFCRFNAQRFLLGAFLSQDFGSLVLLLDGFLLFGEFLLGHRGSQRGGLCSSLGRCLRSCRLCRSHARSFRARGLCPRRFLFLCRL
jgi:hypothetical protein